VILIDTSVWISFLKKHDGSAILALRRALRDGDAATTDVVLMEVLAGTTDSARAAAWDRLLSQTAYLAQEPRTDAEAAARIYRVCRRARETPRRLTDCVIAAVAIRNEVPVLHRDKDFEVIARHTELQVVTS
jgi:predicted nucleic acid-binding protein